MFRQLCLNYVIKKDIYSFLLKNYNNRRETPNRNLRVVSLILLLLSAFAHSSAVLAVLEIIPSSEVEEDLTIDELRLLSDELRRQAVNILPANEFNVLTRDGMFALIPADEKEAECLAQSCAVERQEPF